MAYFVYCDGVPIFDYRDDDLTLIDPQITLEVNKAGSFTFKMPPNHPQYDLPQLMTSCIQVFQDDDEIFNGRPIKVTVDFYNRKEIECEGQLAFLNDTIQRPGEYHDYTVSGYLGLLIASHNVQVDESRQFEVGKVLVTDSNDSLYRYTNMNTTMEELKEDLIDDLGGYLKVRNVYDSDGNLQHRYLDYVPLANYGNTNSQPIRFGENLLDFTRDTDMTDIATALIPLGATLEESDYSALEVRLTIEDVNDGIDYLQIDEAVEKYGFIVKTETWDDVTTAEALLTKGKAWLTDYQYEDMTIEAQAVDMHLTDEEIEAFRLGDMIRVISSPHGLDKYFPLTKMTIYLNKPSSNTVTLGTNDDVSLTARTNEVSSGYSSVTDSISYAASSAMKSAVSQATALITGATQGHVCIDGEEILIMDTNDKTTATYVWRFNSGGLAHSSTGYNGEYSDAAITMDGTIVGSFVAADSLNSQELAVAWNGICNTVSIGTTGIYMYDTSGNEVFYVDSSGNAVFAGKLQAASGTFKGSISLGSVSMSVSTIYDANYGLAYFSTNSNYYISDSGGTSWNVPFFKVRPFLTTSNVGAVLTALDRMNFVVANKVDSLDTSGNADTSDANLESVPMTIHDGTVYVPGGVSTTSDANKKNSIEALSDKYLVFADSLTPRRFRYNDGTSDRYHVGFVAQEVLAAMGAAGLTAQDFAGYVDAGEDGYYLRYEEFIALAFYKIQALEARIEELEANYAA